MKVGDTIEKGGETWTVTEVESDGTAWLRNRDGKTMCAPKEKGWAVPPNPWALP